MIEVRYSLLVCLVEAISNRLEQEEIWSLLMTECNFNNISGFEFTTGMILLKCYLEAR